MDVQHSTATGSRDGYSAVIINKRSSPNSLWREEVPCVHHGQIYCRGKHVAFMSDTGSVFSGSFEFKYFYLYRIYTIFFHSLKNTECTQIDLYSTSLLYENSKFLKKPVRNKPFEITYDRNLSLWCGSAVIFLNPKQNWLCRTNKNKEKLIFCIKNGKINQLSPLLCIPKLEPA